ncbi:MAG: PDZ domain-containing protein [Mycobacterium leprae]
MQWIRKRSERLGAWLVLLAVLVVGLPGLFAVLWLVPTPYYVTAPGAAIDTSRLVSVQNGHPRKGQLFMLVLNAQPANLFFYLDAKLDHRVDLETKQDFLGAIPDYNKYMELSNQMMADSQKTAKALALKALGYGKGVTMDGVAVVDLGTGSPAVGHLQKGDVITGVEGRPVNTAAEIADVMKGIKPGATVKVRVRRGSQEIDLEVPTTESPDPAKKGMAAFNIFITADLKFDLPIPVTISAGSINGPSAGLMFTLQIIDQLSPKPLAGNKRIAGTGTIEPDGSVGPIGGVQQKVYTAEAAGAQVMFVPQANYDDARKVATHLQLVPVRTLDDALAWLKTNAG